MTLSFFNTVNFQERAPVIKKNLTLERRNSESRLQRAFRAFKLIRSMVVSFNQTTCQLLFALNYVSPPTSRQITNALTTASDYVLVLNVVRYSAKYVTVLCPSINILSIRFWGGSLAVCSPNPQNCQDFFETAPQHRMLRSNRFISQLYTKTSDFVYPHVENYTKKSLHISITVKSWRCLLEISDYLLLFATTFRGVFRIQFKIYDGAFYRK